MAKPDAALASSVADLDDMVYLSDGENGQRPLAEAEPGMIPEVKNLYPGEKDSRGRSTTTDKLPDHLPVPEETEETGRYALLIRNRKCYDGRKSLAIESIVVQSPLLKKVLCWVLKDYPCMAPELDRLDVTSPFHPFVHRWQRLTDALNNEGDPETKSHIQLFYDALQKELDDTLEARHDYIAHQTITFSNLWMIFEPGDIVFTKVNKRAYAAKVKNFDARYQDIFRLECEMIYGDGKMFGWGQPRFNILEFDGMVKIKDLAVYPLRYHPRADKVKKQLIEKGRAYERLMGFHHVHYQGIALHLDQPYYVDSRIIIDPDGFKRFHPDYDMNLKPLGKGRLSGSTETESIDEDSDQSGDSSDDDGENSRARIIQAKKRALPALTEDQLLVCGSCVKGYSLRNKRWLDFFVECIKDIEWDDHAWDNVVLDHDLKDLIFEMTNGHRSKQRGLKSKGLNVFLSGSAGVGKTFTVESVAEALRAPLFHVAPADVDLDAKDPDLESPFTDVLEMCGRWNAILLFDQASEALDIDQLEDAQGRGYPLLLDAMESHSAALFVTSNISANTCMDDRLQSRFHVCLQLPDLTSATRGQIWQKCLESHKDISFFANSDALAGWTLNGREIANAVVAAKTLATNGVVEMRHLERVVPAGKRPFPVVDDFWGVPPKKDKQKKSRKVALDRHPVDVVEVVEEPPKREVADVLAGWGFGTPKDKKGKTKTAMEPGKGPEVYLEEDDWNCWAVKEDRKAKRSSDEAAVPPPPSPPSEAEIPAKGTIEVDDGWGSFGVKKDKKKKKKGMTATATEPEAAVAEPKKDSETPAAAPVEVDEWDFWAASKKSKKGKKKPIPLLDDAPPAIEGQAPAASVVASCYSPPTSPTTEERYWNCHGCVDLDP